MKTFQRTEILYGPLSLEKFFNARVTIIGLGAVGSFAAEALARIGVSNFKLVDFDIVEESNINRQLFALHSTISKKKCDIAKERILDINPKAKVESINLFVEKDNLAPITKDTDVIVDAIDSLKSKIDLLEFAANNEIKIVSSMGAARRKDVSKIQCTDLFKTYNCPLASKIRKELRHRKINTHIDCVFSSELAEKETHVQSASEESKRLVGSSVIITGIFGLCLANLAIKKLLA